ncbi:quinohemoprotein amine dehydrogenase subunit alpha [Kaustia mangrovi]|uniref:Quinohemoprotein amine dehydrogenase subunit alpha n=1 Tax=Kaustia mangrovi TaxID=2593653 RepID=A0A7S8HBY1_9HYPH|nr:quinohemoprotein amine dehydrogenase subunit alpha [Kaustia mangrovi]QPC42869.1 quinohemoprotein amine dehydrogenase subunit alpha [Kaustia mangrovi]
MALVGGSGQEAAAQEQTAEALLNARCSACHERRDDGTLNRISDARKTPEAWFMTVFRMTNIHGVQLTDDEQRTIVKYLSDTQGLAPTEGADYRYALEKAPGSIDTAPNDTLFQMCGRCHTFARVALQRRDKADWTKLVHFHLGQFPTTEYQALGRDRDWFAIATGDVVDQLSKLFPYETDAWATWKDKPAPDMSGTWRLAGRQPGNGAYEGHATVAKTGDDTYDVSMSVTFANGDSLEREGKAILYNGHEWRASFPGDDHVIRQVFSVSEDGAMMNGRWMYRDVEALGGRMTAIRAEGTDPRILNVVPSALKQGTTAQIAVNGVGLGETVDLGPGVEIEVLDRSPERMVVKATVSADAAPGARTVVTGDAAASEGFVVYDRVARLEVEPAETIARVGGAGGPIPKIPAQFEAVGYMAGADGEAGTDDDIRIGPMDADWSTEDFDALAAEMKDTRFAGTITPSGLFEPAGAGPNPERPMDTNNAGNLSVVATVEDGGEAVTGKAHLFVTVQRFVTTPMW